VAEACAQALRLGAHRGVDRQAWATAWADAQPPDVRPKLLAFLGGELPAPQAQAALAALPHDGTAQYLAGRLAFGRRAYDQALQHLQQAGPHRYTPLEAERLQLMALSAFRLGRRADARRAAVALVALGPASLYGPWAQDLVTRLDAAPHPGPPGEAG
jgi:tetratricopeptide (TPR) repeat protein